MSINFFHHLHRENHIKKLQTYFNVECLIWVICQMYTVTVTDGYYCVKQVQQTSHYKINLVFVHKLPLVSLSM